MKDAQAIIYATSYFLREVSRLDIFCKYCKESMETKGDSGVYIGSDIYFICDDCRGKEEHHDD